MCPKFGGLRWAEQSRAVDGLAPQQYHGKWPFSRAWGVQEPASAVFSVANLAVHFTQVRRYSHADTVIAADAPHNRYRLVWLWVAFGWLFTFTCA